MPDPIKSPPVRPGQKKGYVKATRQQIEHRIESAALLQFCGVQKSQVHQIFREFYGVEWRQCDRYMARAREETRAKAQPSPGREQ